MAIRSVKDNPDWKQNRTTRVNERGEILYLDKHRNLVGITSIVGGNRDTITGELKLRTDLNRQNVDERDRMANVLLRLLGDESDESTQQRLPFPPLKVLKK